jgi:hypothetical protein
MDLSYGQLVLVALATIFLIVLPFAQGALMKEPKRTMSPYLSLRCAMILAALLPLCIALAGKVNLITILTGISYARLNFWHRYLGSAIFALSICHAVRSHGSSTSPLLMDTYHRFLIL